jgi:hypothetical protein
VTSPDVLEAAKPWMQQCGRCDADMPMGCSCPPGDPRVLISRMAQEIEQTRAHLADAHRLIRDLADEDPCWFDHHGGCQAHSYLSLEPGEKCPQQEAKDLLRQAGDVV